MNDRQRIDLAVAALRRGDSTIALELLRPMRLAGGAGAPPWLLIAEAAEAAGDMAEAEVALSGLLRQEPRSLIGLLLLARLRVTANDHRAAQSLYRTALNVAMQPGARVASELIPMLRQGETFLAEVSKRFTAHLESTVAQAGLADGRAGTRIRESLDLLLGRSELYLQQPSMFYFPGLAQRAFFAREEFPWLAEVEAAIPAMRAEVEQIVAGPSGFSPYVQAQVGRALPANPLLDDPRWSALYLWRGGEVVNENASRCPATMAALAAAPIPRISGRSPMALFSRLEPDTHIKPHHGLLNTRLICHIPLIVPDGCALRVGAETRSWRSGEALIFDDSIEHEAWNRGSATRVVLLFEIWRPELTLEERDALTHIFQTIDDYQGAAIDAG